MQPSQTTEVRPHWRIVQVGKSLINKGSGCSGSTPDCDIVSGAISQCPATSYTGERNKTSVADSIAPVDAASPVPSEASKLTPTSGLRYTEIFRRINRGRVEGPEG